MGVGKTRAITAQLLDNLGVTVSGVFSGGGESATAPTISFPSTGNTGAVQTLTITNWATYYNPVLWVRVVDSGGAEETAPTAVTDNEDGTVSVPMPYDAGTYTVQCKIQEFGKLASTTVSAEIVLTTPAGARYYRLTGFSDHTGAVLGSGVSIGIERWRLFDAVSGGGTQYPPAMSNDTTPSPYVASASYAAPSARDPYRAMDRVTYTSWWLLGHTGAQQLTDWLQIDMGVVQGILSVWVDFMSYSFPNPNGITVVLQSSPDAISWTTLSTTVVPYASLGGVWLL